MSEGSYHDSSPVERQYWPAGRDSAFKIRRVCWGATCIGAVITLMSFAFWIVLMRLGVGIGLGIVQPVSGGFETHAGLGIAGAIWWVVTGMVSLGLGGYAAARLAGVARAKAGVLQGITVWALSTLVLLYPSTTSIAGVLGAAFNHAGSMASMVASIMLCIGLVSAALGGAIGRRCVP